MTSIGSGQFLLPVTRTLNQLPPDGRDENPGLVEHLAANAVLVIRLIGTRNAGVISALPTILNRQFLGSVPLYLDQSLFEALCCLGVVLERLGVVLERLGKISNVIGVRHCF